ncbi:hypothetical protein [Sphingopyxis sp. NJF-3]
MAADLNIVVNGTPTPVYLGENTVIALAAKNSAAISAGSAAASEAVALAAAGPNYADTAAGLAATSEGETFAVEDSGIVTVYRHDAGPTATELRVLPTTGALASTDTGKGAAMVGFQYDSTAEPRDADGKLKDHLPSAQDFGAIPGGTINSGTTFAGSTATAGPDASAKLQALFSQADTEKLPIINLPAGKENYSLLTAPLELQGGGTTVRGQRGMTYSRGLGKAGALILGADVPYGIRVGEGVTPSAPGDSGADCFTFEDIGFMKDTAAPLKSQAGIYWNHQSNGPGRGVNLYGVSATSLRAGFEVAPPVIGASTMIANLTLDGVCFSNNRYGVFASGPLYGLRVVGCQIEQNNAASAPATALTAAAVGAGGTGYVNGARVWLTATDGTGRAARAIIAVSAGAITGFTIEVGGHGYTVGETLSVQSNVGTGATATVTTVGAPAQYDGGAIHGNIQGPVSIMDTQLEGQPNPIDLQPVGGLLPVAGSASIKARVGFNYIESIGVNGSQFAGRFGTTDRTHNNTLDWGPNFYAGSSLPTDFLVFNKRGNWEVNLRDPNAITFNQWNGSILRGSRIFSGPIDHFYIKGISTEPNAAPEIFLGDGFNRHDASGGNLTAAAVAAGGSAYVDGETVSLVGTDGRGFGATATIAVTAGAITGFTIVLPGKGYVSTNPLTVVGGTGTGGTATGTAGATTPWTHSAPFTSGEKVMTPRGPLFVRDATVQTPLGFGVTAGDLVVVTAYVSVQNRNANIFRSQITRNAGTFIASIGDSYADVISRGDWVHICYPFIAPSTVPDIAFKFGTSGGANTVDARIAGLCARNYGAYVNDGTVRQAIAPVAPRLV